MKKPLRQHYLTLSLQTRPPQEKETRLLQEIAGGKSWRIEGVLDAIKPEDWKEIDTARLLGMAAAQKQWAVYEQIENLSAHGSPYQGELLRAIALGEAMAVSTAVTKIQREPEGWAVIDHALVLKTAATFGRAAMAESLCALMGYGRNNPALIGVPAIAEAFDEAVVHGRYLTADVFGARGASGRSAQRAWNTALKQNDKRKARYLIKTGANPATLYACSVGLSTPAFTKHLERLAAPRRQLKIEEPPQP